MADEPSVVLVVDDSEARRYILASWLRRAGHRVAEAATGAAALAQLRDADLVVLDVRLPDISGIEVCERIKADPQTAAIPVIQVSATAVAVADRARGLGQGADAYLAEPIEPEVFLATVTAALRYYQARHRAEQAATRLAALTRVTLAINAAETFDRLARAAADGAAEIFDAIVGLVVIMPDGQLRRITAAPGRPEHQRGGAIGLADNLAGRVLGSGAGNAVAMIPRQEYLRMVPDTALSGDIWLAASRTKPGRPPVVIGVASEGISGEVDRLVLRQLVQSVALAVEALRAYAEEHLVALTLQRSMLPSALPEITGVEMSARYVPASDQAEVGGDFYEVLADGDHLVAAIGDVQGHSLQAATVMGELRHALRAFAAEGHPAPGIASLLNSVLQRYHPNIIATLCLLQLNVLTGDLQIVNCGHMPPLLVGDGGAAYRGQGGMLLGTPVDDPHVEHTVLPHGGTVVLYTDGLVEDRIGALDGNLDRLRLAVQDTSGDLDAFADRVLAVFGPREDDVALLAVRRR
ncbi:MAG: SpoIIE family protein phosphatase [Streptosporangiaceae bacterium]|jgi:serine phosphatase RsbU (regulator of sigma subunit)/CheY-like chemotaxis protein